MFIRPKKYIVSSGSEPPELGYVDIRTLADSVCRYDLNDMDAAWLELTNEEFKEMGESRLCCLVMSRGLQVRGEAPHHLGPWLHLRLRPARLAAADPEPACAPWASGGTEEGCFPRGRSRAPGSHPDLQP